MLGSIAVLSALLCSSTPTERPPNVILVMADDLGWNEVGAYGQQKTRTPNMDRLAAEGVMFETVVSGASWTLPAMAGMMAGDVPTKNHFDTQLGRSLVEDLRAGGLHTAAFVEGGFVSSQYGFDLGFDEFHDESLAGSGDGDHTTEIERTFRAARDWLGANGERPFFLWLHTYEPHTPYRRLDYAGSLDSGSLGETFEVMDSARVRMKQLPFGPTERTYVRALYDGGVTASDREVGELMAELEKLGLRDDTLIVVTSDHGEDIGGREPEWPGTHGHALYDEQILVPLIVHDPSRDYAVKRVTAQVRTIDVLHSMADMLGVPVEDGRWGRSVVPLMTGEEKGHRAGYSHVPASEYFGYEERISIRTGAHKLIMTPTKRGNFVFELFDLASDPGERVTMHVHDPRRRTNLQRAVFAIRRQIAVEGAPKYRVKAKPRDNPVESRVRDRLRELGYIE